MSVMMPSISRRDCPVSKRGLAGKGEADLAAAEEAVLALVDFPKQTVVALCLAVRYMKSKQPPGFAQHNTDQSSFQTSRRIPTSFIVYKGETTFAPMSALSLIILSSSIVPICSCPATL